MSYFFNGRLWTTPAVMSVVNDAAMFNPSLDVGNVVALIGASVGGAPNTPLVFSDPEQARSMLISGDLVDAIKAAFDPSDETVGPSTVVAIRVNPALQSALTLADSTTGPAIDLVSTDYGLYTNQIKVKVEAGSVQGLKLTTSLGLNSYVQDNVYRNAFSIQYTGANASAQMTITNTTVTLASPTGTTVATIALATYPTVQQLVDFINTVPSFSASVLDGNGLAPALNGLDSIAAQDVKTALYTAVANLQAVVDYFNSQAEGLVTATRHTGAGKPPAAIAFTYLTGGSDGVITNTQWSDAFTVLQTVDVQWVTPLTIDASVVAMADAHVVYMSNIGRMERRAITGTATGTTDIAAIAAAKVINSDRTSLVHLGYYDYNAAGVLTLYQPYILAAMIAGAFSGVNPGTPLTNKSLKLRGIERNLRNPADTDALINGGVLCVENTSTGYRVVKSISTWLNNKNFNRVEQSTGVALDFTARSVRKALATLKGAKGNPQTLGLAVAKAETVLRALSVPDPSGPGVLAGDATNPPYKNIQATLIGDVMAVSFQCSPVIPVNYIPVTIFAVPYTGSASV
ncbi:MAG TPA: hypothetical protein DEQ40_08080 [Oxalobacteraceae bacterium]|jgi:hypothetical protein|nr:hypothetical protein [Oxalobacteraceae bacterium]